LSAQPDRIENIPARLDPDQAFDFLRANRFECQREYEGLRDGLYGERYVAIANFVNIAISGCYADAEIVRIGLRKLWNVVGDGTAVVACDFRMAARQKTQQWRLENFTRASRGANDHICARVHAFPPPD